MTGEDVEIRDVPDRHRYELLIDGDVMGFVDYHLRGGTIMMLHTEVDPAFDGRGFGSRLARHVLDDARARGLRVILRCPFIRSYVERHPGYRDLITR